jgi:hypothetical protein
MFAARCRPGGWTCADEQRTSSDLGVEQNSATRQRFTMMHELGHVMAGDVNDLWSMKTFSALSRRPSAAPMCSLPRSVAGRSASRGC